jgi:hypothetical protein
LIEKTAVGIAKKTGKKASIAEINQYFVEHSVLVDVVGIIFHDLPFSDDLLVKKFNYRKRIQLVAYRSTIIHNFALHETMPC